MEKRAWWESLENVRDLFAWMVDVVHESCPDDQLSFAYLLSKPWKFEPEWIVFQASSRARTPVIRPPSMPDMKEVRVHTPMPGRYERITERPRKG
jgi:hypothetical protein